MNAYDETGAPRDLYVAIDHESDRAVALGIDASNALDKFGIGHFVLPHPSPKNQMLNDKREVARLLYRCKKYIYQGNNRA